MLMFESRIEQEEGIIDNKIERNRKKRIVEDLKKDQGRRTERNSARDQSR